MKVLVTGGGGFIGGAVVARLRARGDEVTSIARGDYPHLRQMGVRTVRADLGDPEATPVVNDTVAGHDAVIHTAAKAGAWGPQAEYWPANVMGTQRVLDACRVTNVSRLIFTSSPSVVHGGKDLEGADERVGYPASFDAAYPATKAEAERRVLAANSPALRTVALRPHLVWGPGDPHLVPALIERARAGKLALVGSGDNLVDATYIDNAAQAHVAALDALTATKQMQHHERPAGRAYFIAQGEPVPIRDLINAILAAGGLPPVHRKVPFPLAYALGALAEQLDRWRPSADGPRMTRFLARQFATVHWFDLTAAREDLGYTADVSMAEGLRLLAEHLRARPI